MRLARCVAILIAAAWACPAAPAQQPTSPPRPAPDIRVVFWFDAQGALRHQAYDLRKGEYTKAVNDWVSAIRYDANGYAVLGPMATLRDVRLSEEAGATEKEKLAAAIDREGRAIACGFDVAKLRLSPGAPLLPRAPRRRVAARPVLPMLAPGQMSNYGRFDPLPNPSPFPIPYPRPHP